MSSNRDLGPMSSTGHGFLVTHVTYRHVHTYMHTRGSPHAYTHTHSCTHEHGYTHVHTYRDSHTDSRTYIPTHKDRHLHTYARTHSHIHTQRTHARTPTQTHTTLPPTVRVLKGSTGPRLRRRTGRSTRPTGREVE